MLSLGWAPRDIVLTAVLPAIAAIATLLVLAWIDRARAD
jgi:AAHS family 4-hydroxybenzoate transporter-like MFS transporter